MFHLPNLSQTPFRDIRVLIRADFSNYVPEVAAELNAAFSEKPLEMGGIDRDTFSEEHEIYVKIAPHADSVSIRIEVRRNHSFQASREAVRDILVKFSDLSVGEPTFIVAQQIEVALAERLAVLDGLEEVSFEIECGFEADPEQLPEDGVIRRGLGAKARFGDDVLVLAGAKFAINMEDPSDGVRNSLSWFVEPEYYPNGVLGSIEFRGERDFAMSIVSELVNNAREQFDRYILEQKARAVK